MEPWKSLADIGHHLELNKALMFNQESWLKTCLKKNESTLYGEQCQFSAISSIVEYQEKVPLTNYEEIERYIKRIANGNTDVLFKGSAIAFERTSGSTKEKKLIPYSNESLIDFQTAILPWLSNTIKQYDLKDGYAYWAISPALRVKEFTPAGTPIGLPDGAYLGHEAMSRFEKMSAVPIWVASITELSEWHKATLYWLILRNDLRLISVWSPTFLIMLIEALDYYVNELLNLFEKGGCVAGHNLYADTDASKRLHAYRQNRDLSVLWPELNLISCWADASSEPFFNILKTRFPNVDFQAKGVIATEGVVTVPNKQGQLVLAEKSGFFEFIDQHENLWLAHQLKPGEKYEVVITTSGGLYRYRLGDRFLCEDIIEQRPIFRFIGRSNAVSDMTGEKLTEEFVSDCLSELPGFRMLVPLVKDKPGYALVVDEELQTPQSLIQDIENKLLKNPQYAYSRKMGQLASLVVYQVENPLRRFLSRVANRGVRLSDIKIPALNPRMDCLDIFLGNEI